MQTTGLKLTAARGKRFENSSNLQIHANKAREVRVAEIARGNVKSGGIRGKIYADWEPEPVSTRTGNR